MSREFPTDRLLIISIHHSIYITQICATILGKLASLYTNR